MFKHILVPLDGSHFAEQALPAAMGVAARFESDITLLRVAHAPAISMEANYAQADVITGLRRQAQDEAAAYLKAQKGSLRQQGYRVHMHQAQGRDPAVRILESAAGLGVDLIVMSTHGRSGIRRWLIGSVADRLLRTANVPVLLIRVKEAPLDWTRQEAA